MKNILTTYKRALHKHNNEIRNIPGESFTRYISLPLYSQVNSVFTVSNLDGLYVNTQHACVNIDAEDFFGLNEYGKYVTNHCTRFGNFLLSIAVSRTCICVYLYTTQLLLVSLSSNALRFEVYKLYDNNPVSKYNYIYVWDHSDD